MHFPTRRSLATRGPRALLVVALAAAALLSAAFAADAVAPAPPAYVRQAQDPAPTPNCMEDVAGRTLQCTANDVRVAQYTLVEGPTVCTPGQTVRVKLQAEIESTAQDRYDIGFFVALDGGNARAGQCYRDYLPPPLAARGGYNPGLRFTPPAQGSQPDYSGGGPFLTSEGTGDMCGDVEQGVNTFRDLGEEPAGGGTGPVWVDVICQDWVNAEGEAVPDEIADVGTCVSWDNNANNPACTALEMTLPNTPAKCNCSNVPIAGLVVPKVAYLELVKDVDPDADPGRFDLLVDGVLVSGEEGAGDGYSTGTIVLSAGTSAAPGEQHTVAEAAHPGTDINAYDHAVSCVRQGQAEPFFQGAGVEPAAITFMPGDRVTCTFMNGRHPRLRLVKLVINDDGGTAEATDWTLEATGQRPDGPTNLTGKSPVDSAMWPIFKPDTYTLSETYIDADPGVSHGYQEGAWQCVQTGSDARVPGPEPGQVVVNYGDDIICTIENDDIQPTLKLVKTMNIQYGGTATAADFMAYITTGPTSTYVPWDIALGWPAGAYTLSESGPEGYTASPWGGDCEPDGSIVLLSGDELTCTITNSDNPPPPPAEIRISGRKLYYAFDGPFVGTFVGLSGWEITATSTGANQAMVTTTTNALGEYTFTQAALGDMAQAGATIEVCEEDRAGWRPVGPPCYTLILPTPLPPDYTAVVPDFMNAQDFWYR